MYEYIAGKIDEITPTYLVIEASGIGYRLHISLNTYTSLQGKKEARVYVHQVVREDSNELYGFSQKSEREVFILLISVSGVGASTGQMMLSAMGIGDITSAIAGGDAQLLQSIKGIGAKTAQRIIIDLKDKIQRVGDNVQGSVEGKDEHLEDTESRGQAIAALVMLGFKKNIVEKVVAKVLKNQGRDLSVEEIIKLSLKQM